jgi:hypothetical protein
MPNAMPSIVQEVKFPNRPDKYALHFRNPGPIRNKTEYAVYSEDYFNPGKPQLRETGFIEIDSKGEYYKEFAHHTGGVWSFRKKDLGAVNVCSN